MAAGRAAQNTSQIADMDAEIQDLQESLAAAEANMVGHGLLP